MCHVVKDKRSFLLGDTETYDSNSGEATQREVSRACRRFLSLRFTSREQGSIAQQKLHHLRRVERRNLFVAMFMDAMRPVWAKRFPWLRRPIPLHKEV